MREPLPQTGVGYDRPNRPWTCGRAADGDPCAFGPNQRGVCPSLAECKPVEVAGEWRCDRPAARGGPCDQSLLDPSAFNQGPTLDGQCCRAFSCQPVRNLRSLRGLLVRMGCVFAIGALLMVLGSNIRNRILAPGPLTTHHASVLRGKSWENRCSACHSAADQSTATLISSLAMSQVSSAHTGPAQSTKCMACHEKTISAEFALVAHNMPATELAQISGQETNHNAGELACSVCHQEHHGASHNIAAMDNQRCQSCHTQKFDSFATDHPDLGMYPHFRRTPIAFSHSTHAGKYFAEKNREFSCQQCHMEDSVSGVQLTMSYSNACSECHDSDIATATAGGVELFSLPSLDIETLAEANLDIGQWPEQATGDFDGKLPAIMKLLLAADPKARQAMSMLGADFDFFDVDPDDPKHLQAAADLAVAIRSLMERLAEQPSAKVKSTGEEMLLGLKPTTARAFSSAWFGGESPRTAPPQSTGPGDWFADEVTLALRYKPTGHADPVLKAWIDAVVAIPEPKLRDALLAEFTGPSGPGRCITCHSVEQKMASLSKPLQSRGSLEPGAPKAGLVVNWRPHDRRLEPRSFTRFSHSPHLLQVELRDCSACHTVNPTANTASNYTGQNPAAFVSDFLPISKAACASCHMKASVGDHCTQCHNYHVELP